MLELAPDRNFELLGEYAIETEYDIVMARQTVRQFAKKAGMGIVDQTRITTAVSELFRNMYNYAGGGKVLIERGDVESHDALIITCIDHGPGIENLELAMSDGYTSGMGMGYGLPGTKRLVDRFEIQSKINEGTTVRIMKWK
ncbi:MAG: anti-sigma regulatory factor [Bacteroidales bacterium]|nr:anti-sigma regulatory factor [Bacteroidales bacterium]MCF8457930.1 anti-sigma regulatory factor [Bacteroidales bacterium]